MKAVAVSGLGVISPLGNDVEAFFDALAKGRSGIARLTGKHSERLACRIGAPVAFDGAAHFPASKVRMDG